MPPRSPKMKRRILGFQRRVWWPKWTPASSSSAMPTSATGYSLCCDSGCAARRSRTRSCDLAPSGQGRDPLPRGSRFGSERLRIAASARSERAPRRSAGSGERTLERARRVNGCSKASRVGVQELALEAEQPGGAVLGVAARRDGRSPAGARGSGACGRSPGAARSSDVRRQRALEREVGARLARRRRRRPPCACARAGRARSAPRSCRVRAGGRPSTSARYSRSISRAGERRLQAAVGLLAARDDQQARGVAVEAVHDPRRARGSPPASSGASSCESVSLAVPAAGVHDDARGPCRRRSGARPRRRS